MVPVGLYPRVGKTCQSQRLDMRLPQATVSRRASSGTGGSTGSRPAAEQGTHGRAPLLAGGTRHPSAQRLCLLGWQRGDDLLDFTIENCCIEMTQNVSLNRPRGWNVKRESLIGQRQRLNPDPTKRLVTAAPE